MLQDVAFVASAGFGVRAWGFSEGGEGASGSGERMTDKSVHPTSIRPTRSVRPTANVRPTRLRTPILPPLNGGWSRSTCCTFFGWVCSVKIRSWGSFLGVTVWRWVRFLEWEWGDEWWCWNWFWWDARLDFVLMRRCEGSTP